MNLEFREEIRSGYWNLRVLANADGIHGHVHKLDHPGSWELGGGGMAGVKREKKRGKEDSREAPIFKVQKEEEYLTGTQDLF